MMFKVVSGTLLLLTLPLAAMAVDPDSNPSLVAQLITENMLLDRVNTILPNDNSWAYDFTMNQHYSWNPGSVCVANKATFPAMTGFGMTISLLNLGPCAMLPLHYHRADNMVTAVSGSTDTFMYLENGARVVQTTLTPGKMTIFPRASLHTMVNNGCTNAQLISALNSDDPGTLNVLNAAFLDVLRPILEVLLPGVADYNYTAANIPPVGNGSNAGFPDCLARCQLNGSGGGSGSSKVRLVRGLGE